MNPKQERFCLLYASDREFFGNGVQSYIEAYEPKQRGNWYASARADASRLLTNANILKRIDELLEIELNDAFVDKRLGYWITQLAHPNASIDGIREYNKLKKRINDKFTIRHEFADYTDEELDSELSGIIGTISTGIRDSERKSKKKSKQ